MTAPNNSFADILTAHQVAEHLGISPRTVRNVAARQGIGTLVTPRARLYTPADVERLRPHIRGTVGRPKSR